MPELPEVERARAAIEAAGLHRRIDDVDDTDTFVCRPHAPGEIRAALLGRELSAVHRRGKTMWCDLSADGSSRERSSAPGSSREGSVPDNPTLGIHLGMSGRIVIAAPANVSADAATTEGGDPRPNRAVPGVTTWNRFTITFADGGSLILLDPRRLGRVRLDPHVELLGPDAATVTPTQFRAVLAKGTAPVKARLLDQAAIAGVGNLLADEALWQARIDPRRRVADLAPDDVTCLQRVLRKAVRSAIAKGGVHTGAVISSRHPGAVCPRCGAEMARGVVGGRTTWWCPVEQR